VAAQLARDSFEEFFNSVLVSEVPGNITSAIEELFLIAHDKIKAQCPLLTSLTVNNTTLTLEKDQYGRFTYGGKGSSWSYLQDFGTTAVVAYLYFEGDKLKLVMANTGDSLGFIARKSTRGYIPIGELTVIHSIEHSASEWERVSKYGMRRTGGPYIAPPLDSGISHYEIAMTRALGHQYLEKYGLIASPHIKTDYEIDPDDRYLILTSDGVTDVLNYYQILEIIDNEELAVKDLRSLARIIVKESVQAWKTKYPNPDGDLSKIADNTTIIIIDLAKIQGKPGSPPIAIQLHNTSTSSLQTEVPSPTPPRLHKSDKDT